jgi:hypothetical protein
MDDMRRKILHRVRASRGADYPHSAQSSGMKAARRVRKLFRHKRGGGDAAHSEEMTERSLESHGPLAGFRGDSGQKSAGGRRRGGLSFLGLIVFWVLVKGTR